MKKSLLITLGLVGLALQAQNKLLSHTEEAFDGTTWELSSGADYEYDGNNNLTSQTYYDWTDSQWKISDKFTYSYNSNNKVTQYITQFWSTNQLVNEGENLINYNSDGKPIEYVFQNWQSSQWVDEAKAEISYSNNLIDLMLFSTWDGTQWTEFERITPTYSNNLISIQLTEEFDGTIWKDSYRQTYTYNTDNKIIETIEEQWNGSSWDEDTKTVYEWDSDGNQISATTTGAYNHKEEFEYNLTQLLADFANPFRDKTGIDYFDGEIPHVNKILQTNQFALNSNTNLFEPNNRLIYNYDALILSSDKDLNPQTLSLYPNPSEDYIVLNGLAKDLSINIFNLLGAKVLETGVKSNQKIDIQHLKSGLYFLTIENGNTIKFIKK